MKKSKNAPKSILIVEDDKTSVILLEKLLKNYGYSVADIVETGEDALVKAGTTEPDLILMDITLKGKLDGIEAAAEISNKYHIPIVFMTANTDDSTIERAKVTMPYGYILKPYDKNMLYATIEMALYKFNTEGMLIESEKRNRDILSSIPDVMFTLDEEGNFLHEVEADIAQRIWPKKVSEVGLPQIKKAIDSGNETTFEYTLKKSDNKCYYEARILVSGDNRVLVIVRDITGRKHAELELQDYKQKLEELVEKRTFELNTANKSLESESTLRMKMGENLKIFSHAIEQSPNMVVFLDKHGTIEYVNRKFSEISGYSPDEVVETVVSKQGNKVIPEPEIWNSIISVKKWDGEIYNVNKKGDLYYLRAYVTFIKGEDSRISHYILVAEDITRIKKEKMAIENVKESIDKSRSEKLDLELDWREWKEKMLSRNVSRTDKSLFRNINNSFTQGAGFGTLISLLEMLRTDSEVTGDKYIVDRKIFELILENVTISQNAFKTFSNID
jgi:PAS domain S-box-containing protein